MNNFSHRERVITTLSHKELDRILRDLGGRVSSMIKNAYNSLKHYFNLDECGYDTINSDYFTVAEFDERIHQFF